MTLHSRHSRALLLAVLLVGGALLLLAGANSFSLPTRSTGGNFSEESSCTRCHTGAAGSGSIAVTVGGTPLDQYRYTPGELVTLAVRIAEAGKKSFGFQATARHPDGCVQAGIFNALDDTVFVQTDAATPEGCSGSTVQFPGHQTAIAANGEATFTFQWTAPLEDIGDIRWAAAGLAGDGDGTAVGDSTYELEATTPPASSVPVSPMINAGGVVLATGTPTVRQFSPGAIATVYGEQFAPEGTSILQPELDENGRVQKKVANTCVEVNGEWAPLYAILPTQINFQMLADVGLGTAEVRVVRGCNSEIEQKTAAEMITVIEAAPAFFNFSNAANGVNPIAAQRSDYSLLAADGQFGSSSPAEPGEIVHLYATGFGATNPPIPTGGIPRSEVPNGVAEVVNPAAVRIRVGSMDVPPSDIFYVGASPCCAGLYQATFRVPATLPNGNHQVVITINGVASPAGPYIAVRRR